MNNLLSTPITTIHYVLPQGAYHESCAFSYYPSGVSNYNEMTAGGKFAVVFSPSPYSHVSIPKGWFYTRFKTLKNGCCQIIDQRDLTADEIQYFESLMAIEREKAIVIAEEKKKTEEAKAT
jgi:hypothetical protein